MGTWRDGVSYFLHGTIKVNLSNTERIWDCDICILSSIASIFVDRKL